MTILASSASSNAAPGTLGFIVVFGMAVILVFVFRSMSRHIRRVNDAARRQEDAQASAAKDAASSDQERSPSTRP